MTKVLVTGGSGFIAGHLVDQLLEKGYAVVTTVRSEDKAQKIRNAYSDKSDKLEVLIVPDISKEGAFDEVAKIPGLDAVMHTASPFHYNWTDPQTGLIEPALVGTSGILKAIKRSAPSVKRVVITSSFAAIINEAKFFDSNHTFTEKSWNPDGLEDIHRSQPTAYRVSKTLAERSAWDFVANEKPNFDLVTICPPLVLGPVVRHFATIDNINTSNERIVAMLQGKWKTGIPSPAPVPLWIDVRDAARAHVLAMEKPEMSGHRLLATGGSMSNRQLVDIVRANFPGFAERLPVPEVEGGEIPDQIFKYNNEETVKLLGIEWISLDKSITDLTKMLQSLGI